MKRIIGRTFEAERSLYRLTDTELIDCVFGGPEDGESPLKHPENFRLKNCDFSLRYPIWHAKDFEIEDCSFDKLARAALWYCYDGKIINTKLHGIKALRDCQNVLLEGCSIKSPEFGWKCRGIMLRDCSIEAEYLFLDTADLTLKNCRQKGKYSFQYIRDLLIEDSELDTKDAFWHSENVTVRNSHLKGEYLAWYSTNLTLENCVIEGTQPLCFCQGLKLINCRMVNCDLAFEFSDVQAKVIGSIDSIKNPRSGRIEADEIKEIILDEPGEAEITELNK
ncbi:DUF3737 family protein [Parasutterella muris]|uniref:DUF3737 family protein n=1 Tax=Parasutterella muris TaxID=2565572 RepID=A0A6L6YEN4_9BURK|nr:DUF3737 family protein [Parasutterella muris]MVX56046.1 DUF3737 family protein [Parasutterella muris]